MVIFILCNGVGVFQYSMCGGTLETTQAQEVSRRLETQSLLAPLQVQP